MKEFFYLLMQLGNGLISFIDFLIELFYEGGFLSFIFLLKLG